MFNKDSMEDSKSTVPGWSGWTKRIQKFIKEEYNDTLGTGINCPADTADSKKYCKFDRRDLGTCGKGNFGYDKGQPCIFLKINRIYGLVPEYYNDTGRLPSDEDKKLPDDLVKHIKAQKQKNVVWVHCHGENPADTEMMGEIEYFPKVQGYPQEYFPYLNQVGYQSPLLAVQFKNPAKGHLLHIECRAYAGNIRYDRMDRVGKAHFELIMHDSTTAGKVDQAL